MQRRAIARLELLVAVVVCLLAIGLVVTFIAHHRETAQRVQCTNNLRLMGEAIQKYHENSPDKRLPPSRIADGYATWAVLIAPYLSEKHALTQWAVEDSYFVQPEDVRQARLIFFFCPSRTRADTLSSAGDVNAAIVHVPGALGDYASVAGDGTTDWTGPKANGALIIADVTERKGDRILKWQSRTKLDDLKRGQAYTMLIGEKHVPSDQMGDAAIGDGSLYNGQHPVSFSRVVGPAFPLAPSPDAPFNKNFGSYHNGIVQFLNADATVRTFALDVSEQVLGELATREVQP